MSTQPKPQVEATKAIPVGERTDRELENRANSLVRARETRLGNIAEIQGKIAAIDEEHDAIIDEQARRLQAKRTRPVEAQVGEKDGEQQ